MIRSYSMTFPEKVKFVRTKLLVSQEELAVQIGASFATINCWETKNIEQSFLTKALFDKYCEMKGIRFEEDNDV